MERTVKFLLRPKGDGSWDLVCLSCFRRVAEERGFRPDKMGEAIEAHSCPAMPRNAHVRPEFTN